jgi:hypothetical protein
MSHHHGSKNYMMYHNLLTHHLHNFFVRIIHRYPYNIHNILSIQLRLSILSIPLQLGLSILSIFLQLPSQYPPPSPSQYSSSYPLPLTQDDLDFEIVREKRSFFGLRNLTNVPFLFFFFLGALS